MVGVIGNSSRILQVSRVSALPCSWLHKGQNPRLLNGNPRLKSPDLLSSSRSVKRVRTCSLPDNEEGADEFEVIDGYNVNEKGLLESEAVAAVLKIGFAAVVLGGILILGYLALPIIDVSVSSFPGAQ